jgi:hypothetical protein
MADWISEMDPLWLAGIVEDLARAFSFADE